MDFVPISTRMESEVRFHAIDVLMANISIRTNTYELKIVSHSICCGLVG